MKINISANWKSTQHSGDLFVFVSFMGPNNNIQAKPLQWHDQTIRLIFKRTMMIDVFVIFGTPRVDITTHSVRTFYLVWWKNGLSTRNRRVSNYKLTHTQIETNVQTSARRSNGDWQRDRLAWKCKPVVWRTIWRDHCQLVTMMTTRSSAQWITSIIQNID